MNKLSACAALGLAACLIAPGIAVAQDKTDEAVVAPQVAATIDGDPIYVNEIDAMLLNLQKNRQVNPQTAPIVRRNPGPDYQPPPGRARCCGATRPTSRRLKSRKKWTNTRRKLTACE